MNIMFSKTKTPKITEQKNIVYQELFWAFLIILLSLTLLVIRSSERTAPELISLNDPAPKMRESRNNNVGSDGNRVAPNNQAKNDQPGDAAPKNVEYNYRQENKVQAKQIVTKNGDTYPLRTYEPQLTPNDTYANQWWVAPTGMASAWDIPAGAKQVTTAVIDTGFALNHQEFNSRWAYNNSESGETLAEGASRKNCADRGLSLNQSCNNIDDDYDGVVDNETGPTTLQHSSTLNCTDRALPLNKSCNMIDDDGNGLVDDYLGWDFINFERSPQAGETNPDGDGTMHGTMVAGVMAATGNNGVGIAGVNWQTKILPLQALNDDSYGNTYTVANAVDYAVERGVDIINISLGTDYEDPYLRQAILAAQEAGILVVASAGNDGCNCMVYPANYPEVIAVGASDSSGNVTSFSSYGANLDAVAPGSNMTTPYWTKANGVSAYASGGSGTSFSSPFVAGVFGLMKSHQPNASWDELAGIMFENSDRKSLTASAPRNDSLGFGSIVASSALTRSYSAFAPPIVYRFGGNYLGGERIKICDTAVIPGTFLYEISKNGVVKYSVNRYEIRKAETNGWTTKKMFGVCVGLPTDAPDVLRVISLSQEIRNQQDK